jgi:hypothetical protein
MFSGTLQIFNMCPTRNTTHIKTVIKFLPNSLWHVVVSHCDGCCDARAQVNQRRWKWWYKNTILDETPQEEVTRGKIWGTWWPTHQSRGLLRKLTRTRSTAPSSVDGRPVDFRLQMQPVSWNCKYHFQIDLPLGGSVQNFVWKCCWTLTTDLFTWKSRTQNDLCSPLVTIFLSCLLVDNSGTNAGKINFESLPSIAHIS